MKLAYLSHASLPSWDTNTEQMLRTAAELVRRGVAVDFFVRGLPGRAPGASDRAAAIGEFYDLPADLWGKGLAVHERPRARFRLKPLAEAWHDLFVTRAAACGGHDALYTRDPVILALALRAGPPVVFESFRLTLSTAARFAPWRRLCYRSPRLAGVVAHSRLAADAFVAAGAPADRVLVAHNGHVPEWFEGLPPREEARARLGWEPGEPTVVYTGHVDPGKGVDAVLDVAARVPEARFRIVGAMPGSAGERALLAGVRRRGLANVRVLARVRPPEVPLRLAAADCLIIPPTARPLEHHGRTVLPMKTFAYLASGRPILAPDLADVREVLTDGRNACLVPPDAPDVAAGRLRDLLADPARASALAEAARADARGYTWAGRAERIQRFVEARLAAR